MPTGVTLSTTGTGSSALSKGQKILVANAKRASEAAAPSPYLVMNEDCPQGHITWSIQTFGRLGNAEAVEEANDLTTIQQLHTKNVEVTPTEHGVLCTVSKLLLRRQGNINIMSAVGSMLGDSMMRRMDKDVLDLFPGFTKKVVGAGNTLDVSHFRGSVAYLRTDDGLADGSAEYGMAPMPLNGVLHIEQISDILANLIERGTTGNKMGSGGSAMADKMVKSWWKGRDSLYSVGIYEGGYIQRVNNDGTGPGNNAQGAIFNEGALALVQGYGDEPTVDPDPSYRREEHGLFKSWGETERVDSWGVCLFSDAAATV